MAGIFSFFRSTPIITDKYINTIILTPLQKKVSFTTIVKVILIPSRKDYIAAGLVPELW